MEWVQIHVLVWMNKTTLSYKVDIITIIGVYNFNNSFLHERIYINNIWKPS